MKIKLVFGSTLVTAAMGAFSAVGSYAAVAAQDMKSQWNGAFTVEQAGRGEALYTDRCGVCHGAELGGSEMALGLIRFGGHLSGGEYDVETDGRHTKATSASPVY